MPKKPSFIKIIPLARAGFNRKNIPQNRQIYKAFLLFTCATPIFSERQKYPIKIPGQRHVSNLRSQSEEFSITVEISAAVDRVWSVMSDVERWHEWTPSVTSIRKHAGPLRVVSRIVIRQPKLPPASWRVVELEQRRGFTAVTGSPLLRVTARHWMDPERSGTRVVLSIRFSGPLGRIVARLTRGLNQRYPALEANGLKERCESSVPHQRIEPEGDSFREER